MVGEGRTRVHTRLLIVSGFAVTSQNVQVQHCVTSHSSVQDTVVGSGLSPFVTLSQSNEVPPVSLP